MDWISIKEKPQDDQAVLGLNSKVQMLPVKCYYCAEWNEFMSLEIGAGTNHPLSLTHWMPIPESPKKK